MTMNAWSEASECAAYKSTFSALMYLGNGTFSEQNVYITLFSEILYLLDSIVTQFNLLN